MPPVDKVDKDALAKTKIKEEKVNIKHEKEEKPTTDDDSTALTTLATAATAEQIKMKTEQVKIHFLILLFS